MTEKIRAELQKLYDIDAVIVRPGVSTRGSAIASSQKSSASLRMLSVSRLERNKRIDWVLRALATLDTQNFDWKFEVVGDGAEVESLKSLAVELGLQDRAIFHGHLSEEKLAEAYARANLFLMPAVQGYGLPALEALSRGIPTIVHRDSGVSEILVGSSWVEIVDGNNGSLTKAITVMLDRLQEDVLTSCNMPAVPRSSEWARAVCRECGWLPASRI
jgi:glycosyltransferase involved in cell wall biosynthesis